MLTCAHTCLHNNIYPPTPILHTARHVWVIMDNRLENEDVQRNGIVAINNAEGMSRKNFSRETVKLIMDSIQNAIPIRMAGMFNQCLIWRSHVDIVVSVVDASSPLGRSVWCACAAIHKHMYIYLWRVLLLFTIEGKLSFDTPGFKKVALNEVMVSYFAC